MRIAIVTAHSRAYERLAGYTLPNKREYAQRHGYELVAHEREEASGWDHLEMVLAVLPMWDAVLWMDCDAIFTDMRPRLEGFLDPSMAIVMSEDCYSVNAGIWMVANVPLGRQLLRSMLEERRCNPGRQENEQQAFTRYLGMRLYSAGWYAPPQCFFNAYRLDAHPSRGADESGRWTPASFVLHLAGLGLETKYALLEQHLPMVRR